MIKQLDVGSFTSTPTKLFEFNHELFRCYNFLNRNWLWQNSLDFLYSIEFSTNYKFIQNRCGTGLYPRRLVSCLFYFIVRTSIVWFPLC